MKESVASQKSCPMAFMLPNQSSGNGKCLGSKCMAWFVWDVNEPDEGECGMVPPREINVNRRGD